MSESNRRGRFPSASGAPRWYSCPGSHLAEMEVTSRENYVEVSGDDANEGTLLHEKMAVLGAYGAPKDAFQDLTEEQNATLMQAVLLRDEALGLLPPLEEGQKEENLVEERLWMHTDSLDPLLSGQTDLIVIRGKRALIIDYKFGRNEVGSAASNPQLRTYAAILADVKRNRFESIYVAIVQPWASSENRLTIADYGEKELALAHAEVMMKAGQAMTKGNPRIPGSHCRYCKFLSECPEANALCVVSNGVDGNEILSKPVTARELELFKIAEHIIDKRREMAKAMLASDPNAIPGWKLGNPRITTKVTDAAEAWLKLSGKLGAHTFAQACNVSLPKLVKPWKEATNAKNQKEARESLESLLMDVIEQSAGSAPLVAESGGD
jgi:hypothetical protein